MTDQDLWEQIYEHLYEQLGREPTDGEIRKYYEDLEAHAYDLDESEATGN